MNGIETIVFCEGYYDRQFWAGWLTGLGCVDPGKDSGTNCRNPIWDPFGKKVGGGQYAYRSPSRAFIRIVPCGGGTNVLQQAQERLKRRGREPVRHVVVCRDGDDTGQQLPELENYIRQTEPSVTNRGSTIALDDGATRVSLVRWTTNDPPIPGVPTKQTLERLVCSALLAVYPHRGITVENWLKSRPDPPSLSVVKEYSWSHMAGWYAEHGCEDFYRYVWQVPPVAAELELRLRESGAWQTAEELAK
jgi:hypothetical protein